MNEKFFTKKKDSITLGEILELTKAEVSSEADRNKKIKNVAILKTATEEDVSFLTNAKYAKDLEVSKAGFCFVKKEFAERVKSPTIALIHPNPHFAYTQVMIALYGVPIFDVKPGISKSAFVHPEAKIGENVEIQEGAYIDKNVSIGSGSKICANTVIYHDCEIGENCFIGANSVISYSTVGKNTIIRNGAKIGQCGYGFVFNQGFIHKIPQIGIVKIGDNVEIGASTCIDRGTILDTIIGNNAKIDNLVHIAHGVKVGQGCFITALVGIAGSTKLGNFVQVGGHSGINGHIEIGDGAQIAGHSGVVKNVKPMEKVGGYPALPLRLWHRINIKLKQLVNK